MEENKIANFLLSTPDFFLRHAEVLTQIRIPSPHGKQVISLAEKQVQVLREENNILKKRIDEFFKLGKENDRLSKNLTLWNSFLLIEQNLNELPTVLAAQLVSIFKVSYAEVIFFSSIDTSNKIGDHPSIVHDFLQPFVRKLNEPYCNNEGVEGTIGWLFHKYRFKQLESIALLPLLQPKIKLLMESNKLKNKVNSTYLNKNHQNNLTTQFGVLMIGDSNKERFHKNVATDFLSQIADLASAALSKCLS